MINLAYYATVNCVGKPLQTGEREMEEERDGRMGVCEK